MVEVRARRPETREEPPRRQRPVARKARECSAGASLLEWIKESRRWLLGLLGLLSLCSLSPRPHESQHVTIVFLVIEPNPESGEREVVEVIRRSSNVTTAIPASLPPSADTAGPASIGGQSPATVFSSDGESASKKAGFSFLPPRLHVKAPTRTPAGFGLSGFGPAPPRP